MRTLAECPLRVIDRIMTQHPDELEDRAVRFAAQRQSRIEHRLGYGKDGSIFSTDRATAIKIHQRRTSFVRELECYQAIAECGVRDVLGHRVPQLVAWDEDLLAIEMTIVKPPFLLDFGDAYLDRAPEFTEEV